MPPEQKIELVKARAPIYFAALGVAIALFAFFCSSDNQRFDRALDLARDLVLMGGGGLGAAGTAANYLAKKNEPTSEAIDRSITRPYPQDLP